MLTLTTGTTHLCTLNIVQEWQFGTLATQTVIIAVFMLGAVQFEAN